MIKSKVIFIGDHNFMAKKSFFESPVMRTRIKSSTVSLFPEAALGYLLGPVLALLCNGVINVWLVQYWDKVLRLGELAPVFETVMPIVSAFLSTFLAKYICPEYANHIAERTSFVPSEVLMLIPTLLIAALGEEIAMRGFMQNKLTKYISFVPALIITSILFAMCHVSQGSIAVVLYDLVFIFIDSIFYGLIFKRTNNVCVSTISHFIANLLSVLVFL